MLRQRGATAPSPAGRDAAEARQPVTLRRQPVRTLLLAGDCAVHACWRALRWLHRRRFSTVCPALLLLSAWALARRTPGAHAAPLAEFQIWLAFACWWLALGVASSIGFGAGLHTGLLFLVPHVAKVREPRGLRRRRSRPVLAV
jgi:hypothetical protein